MDLFHEKQNLTSQVTCDNPYVKIQECKDKKKAHTQRYIYIYIFIYIAINIATEPGVVLFSTNINFEFSLVVLHDPRCQKLSADR